MRLAHISIKVDDLEAAGEFYEKVLGFRDVRSGVNRDHYSRHMTDGNIDLALIKYQEGATSLDSQVGGDGPCIHHVGFEVDDLEKWKAQIEDLGLEIISEPGVIPIKFVAPGGHIAEVAPAHHFDLEPR
ncbi:MAG: VOC family protein [Proteobacteria bacterium]|nr:VOC family protein [Pseudomonadota bacterium]